MKTEKTEKTKKIVKTARSTFTLIQSCCFLAGLIFTTAKASGVQRSFTDSRGRSISITKKPQRIASGTVASDEIIVELLTRSQSMKRLIALSTLAENPLYSNISQQAPRGRGKVGTETESILSLKPDIIFLASYNRAELIKRLEDAKLKIFVLGNFSSIEDIESNIATIGKIIHEEQSANALLKDFRAKVRKLQKKGQTTKKRKPAIINWSANGTVMAKETIFDSMIHTIGATNAVDSLNLKGWPKISQEILITLKPDFIVASGEEKDRKSILKAMRTQQSWKNLAAVKKEKLILIPPRQLTATSHHIIKAMQKISKEIEMSRKDNQK